MSVFFSFARHSLCRAFFLSFLQLSRVLSLLLSTVPTALFDQSRPGRIHEIKDGNKYSQDNFTGKIVLIMTTSLNSRCFLCRFRAGR